MRNIYANNIEYPMERDMLRRYPSDENYMNDMEYPMERDLLRRYPNEERDMQRRYPNDEHYMNEQIVRQIQDCEATCEHLINHIKKMNDCQMRAKQTMLLRDCADICGLTANYIARDAIFKRHSAILCADICDACGKECDKFPDKESRNCAQICFHCAMQCRAFSRIDM